MSGGFQPSLDFAASAAAAEDGEALIVDVDGYEGPLHVLLALARTQKVDLLKLSVTKLAEQYLAFVREARRRRFSLAADYLKARGHEDAVAFLKTLTAPKRPMQFRGVGTGEWGKNRETFGTAVCEQLAPEGVIGAIAGRALYEGKIDLQQAQAAANKALGKKD